MALSIALIFAVLILAFAVAYKFSSRVQSLVSRWFADGKTVLEGKSLTDGEHQLIQKLFFNTVFSLLGYMARNGGQLDKAEVRLVYVYLPAMLLDTGEKDEAMRVFAAALEPQFQLKAVLDRFKWPVEKKSDMAEILLAYLINLARADGLLAKAELDVLAEAADGLGIANAQFQNLLRTISSQNTFSHFRKNTQLTKADSHDSDLLAVACNALGVSAQSDQREIRDAYRKLLNQYHPVRLRAQGLPNFMVRAAVEHIKRIQMAYDSIKSFRETL